MLPGSPLPPFLKREPGNEARLQAVCTHIDDSCQSGVMHVAGLFCGWKFLWKAGRGPQLHFMVHFCLCLMWTLNLCKLWFRWRTHSQTLDSGYARLEERWSTSVSSLVWEASTSTKHEIRWCSHTWMRGTGPVFWSCLCLVHFSVHFLHHHTWDSLTQCHEIFHSRNLPPTLQP